MGVRKLKPMTPGQRLRSVNDFAAVTASAPEKSLTVPKKRSGGRT
ncbi:MAG: 50S ribosomal protein L2, partial [Schleiferiaceae bacterium]